jgi:hypothetical protein
MAKGDSDAPQGLAIEMHDRWTRFTGSKQDLVSEGVVSEEHFPVLPKRVRRTAFTDKADNVDVVVRRMPGGRFEVVRHHPPAEKLPVRSEEYASPEAWCHSREIRITTLLTILEGWANGRVEAESFGSTSIRYDDATLAEIKAATLKILDAVQSGHAIWTGTAAKVSNKLPAAKTDDQLQKFISRIARSD